MYTERLQTLEGQQLRRALFSLKQIFKDDKDLVHEFVSSGGLDCLLKIGQKSDQSSQNYILKALGEIMVYVDGMNGVGAHAPTVQWLYQLLSSKFRLVAKTAVKLLVMFVDYCEQNSLLLIEAVNAVEKDEGRKPWSRLIAILEDRDSDPELLTLSMTLVNKVRHVIFICAISKIVCLRPQVICSLPDQDSFFDVTDVLEQQGMETLIKTILARPNTEPDLTRQLEIYERELAKEDGASVASDPALQQLHNGNNRTATEEPGRKSVRHKENDNITLKNHVNGREIDNAKNGRENVDNTGDSQSLYQSRQTLHLQKPQQTIPEWQPAPTEG